jgi:hypothetical protein
MGNLSQNETVILSYLLGAREVRAQVLRAKLVPRREPTPIPFSGKAPTLRSHPKRAWNIGAELSSPPVSRAWHAG